ncbi:MAG TPA: GNAT family N-acetyltransferase [Solirubrobacterales bacterium]|nr:GNAT family N-acetyltransferase [Solirubrobacterales bacterium]
MAGERRIVELGVGEVDLVAGLWKEMVGHHQDAVGGRWPGRDPEAAWRFRRAQYVAWLESGEGRLFVVPGARDEATPLAYACLRIGAAPSTFDLGERIGDLESLSVTAAARGQGIGTLLIEHCRSLLRAAGVTHWTVTAIAANVDAVRLYEREGFEVLSHNMLGQVQGKRPGASL